MLSNVWNFVFVERDCFRHIITGVKPYTITRQHRLKLTQQNASGTVFQELLQDHQAANVKQADINATADRTDNFPSSESTLYGRDF